MRQLLLVLACSLSLSAQAADVVLGKISEISFPGTGLDRVAVFGGAPAPEGWSDPNTYLALWEYQTTNATQTLDTSGNGLNVSNLPSVASGPASVVLGTNQYGRVEYGYQFDGVDDRFAGVANSNVLNVSTGTIGGWAFIDDGDSYQTLFTVGHDVDTSYSAITMSIEDTTALTDVDVWCLVNGSFEWRFALTGDPLGDITNFWFHWAMRQDGTNVDFFIDGVDQSEAYLETTDLTAWFDDCFAGTTPPDALQHGVYENSGGFFRWFSGKQDGLFITAAPLSSNEIAEIVANTHPTNNVRIR